MRGSAAARSGQAGKSVDHSFKHEAIQHRTSPAIYEDHPSPDGPAPASRAAYQKSALPKNTHLTFDELPFDSGIQSPDSKTVESELPPLESHTQPARPRRPVSYISWKYLGDTDGVLGCLTGKVDASQPPEEVRKKLANMPMAMKKYKVDLSEPQAPQRRVRGRDLFALSIRGKANEDQKRMTISRLKRAQARIPAQENNTMLFLETDDRKLIPLTVSRLQRM